MKTFTWTIGLSFKLSYFPKTTKRGSIQATSHCSNLIIKIKSPIYCIFRNNIQQHENVSFQTELFFAFIKFFTGNLVSFQFRKNNQIISKYLKIKKNLKKALSEAKGPYIID